MLITSFSQKGYHEYGKRFIETTLEHWKDERLRVYFEHGIPSSAPRDDRVEYIDLYTLQGFEAFELALRGSDPIFAGIMATPEGKQVYNFRYDAMRFFRKAFCIHHACTEDGTDPRVAWLDADSYAFADVPANFLYATLPENTFIAHLQREWLYTESGFVVFNTNHEECVPFMKLYMDTYLNGAFKLLGEWHDCYVLDLCIKQLNVTRVHLTKDEQAPHPFNDSVIGAHYDHMKGPDRKKQGKSHEHELKQRSA